MWAYELRISDWSSDVSSSDLRDHRIAAASPGAVEAVAEPGEAEADGDEAGTQHGGGTQVEAGRDHRAAGPGAERIADVEGADIERGGQRRGILRLVEYAGLQAGHRPAEIGRASCRERVWQSV